MESFETFFLSSVLLSLYITSIDDRKNQANQHLHDFLIVNFIFYCFDCIKTDYFVFAPWWLCAV